MADFATLALRIQNGPFNRGVDESSGKLGKLMSTAKLAAGAVAMVFASKMIVGVAKNFVDAANQQELALKKLHASLAQNGDAADFLVPKFERFAAQMQKQTIFGDELIMEQMAMGVNLGITSDKIEEATKASIGLAARYGIDLPTAMMLMGRASQGQTEMLTRYGIVIDKNLSDQEKFNQLLEIGAGSFQLAQAQTQTFSGKLEQFSNQWGDLKEKFGLFILEGLKLPELLENISTWLVKVQSYIEANREAWLYMFNVAIIEVERWGRIVGTVFGMALGNAWEMISWIATNWDKLWDNALDIVIGFGKDCINYFLNVITFWKDLVTGVFNGIWNYLKTWFSGLVSFAGTVWEQIKNIFKGGSVSDALTAVGASALDAATSNLISAGESFNNIKDQVFVDIAKGIADIGRETEAAMAKSGFSKLELTGYDQLIDKIKQINEEADAKNEGLFGKTMDKFRKPIGAKKAKDGDKDGDEETLAAKTAVSNAVAKVENTLSDAIERGSMEAFKLESRQVTRDDKIAKNTQDTAKNTKDIVKAVNKIAKTAGGMTLVDAFAMS